MDDQRQEPNLPEIEDLELGEEAADVKGGAVPAPDGGIAVGYGGKVGIGYGGGLDPSGRVKAPRP